MKKAKKIISMTLIIITILSLGVISYGFGINDLPGTDIRAESFERTGNSIVKIISTIGVVISVVMLIVIGIKYMMGSVNEKAEYKKTLLPYVIGAAIVFAASGIANIIYELAIQI